MVTSSEGRTIQSVDHSCYIIDVLRRTGGATVSELADITGLSPGSVHTHLSTLKSHNFVIQDEQAYRLGPQFLILGEHVRNHNRVYQAAKEAVEELAEATGEGAHLIIEHQGRVFVLYEVFGDKAIGEKYHARKREESLKHLHCTASGKAMLSRFSADRVESIIDRHGLEQNTTNTITDRDALFEALEQAREREFAISDEEQIVGIRAVGAPIMRTDGTVAGAISVSGPTSRLKADRFHEEIPEKVRHATNVAEVNLNSDLEI